MCERKEDGFEIELFPFEFERIIILAEYIVFFYADRQIFFGICLSQTFEKCLGIIGTANGALIRK